MSIAPDGYATLAAIGSHPDQFRAIRVDVDKAARALVIKCLKSKALDLGGLRAVATALGSGFDLLLDGLKTAELKSLLSRLDKHNADAKSETDDWRRKRIRALADGESPATAPIKPLKSTAKKSAAKLSSAKSPKDADEPKRLRSESMDLFRAGNKKR